MVFHEIFVKETTHCIYCYSDLVLTKHFHEYFSKTY
jgi:hypothetical protein